MKRGEIKLCLKADGPVAPMLYDACSIGCLQMLCQLRTVCGFRCHESVMMNQGRSVKRENVRGR
jgi:hypothetical protein